MPLQLSISGFEELTEIGNSLLVGSKIRLLHLLQGFIDTLDGAEEGCKASLFRTIGLLVLTLAFESLEYLPFSDDVLFIALDVGRLSNSLDGVDNPIDIC